MSHSQSEVALCKMDSMITRFAEFTGRLLDSLIGTGIREILNSILASVATPVAALRRLGAPYLL